MESLRQGTKFSLHMQTLYACRKASLPLAYAIGLSAHLTRGDGSGMQLTGGRLGFEDFIDGQVV